MSRADRQAGRQALAGLMLSLSTVMCCYATQAEKALLCLYAWLHDTGRGWLRKERRKVERRKIKSITEAGLEEKTWVSGR